MITRSVGSGLFSSSSAAWWLTRAYLIADNAIDHGSRFMGYRNVEPDGLRFRYLFAFQILVNHEVLGTYQIRATPHGHVSVVDKISVVTATATT